MILSESCDPANHAPIHIEEAMEEGEVDEVPFTEGHLNEAARALVSILKHATQLNPSFLA